MDCAMGQGFYLGRPMSPGDLAQRLREQNERSEQNGRIEVAVAQPHG
jgi:hypothetical protein